MSECVFVANKANCPTDPEPPKPAVCTPFEVCVGNSTLAYDGECLTLSPRSYQIPDGTYSQISFAGGCIVGVGEAPIAAYTPNACCGPAGSVPSQEAGAAVSVSPHACNWLSNGPAGLMVSPTIQPGGGVEITGCGTPNDPLRISVPASAGGLFASAGDSPTRVEGTGELSSPLIIGMNPSGVQAGTYYGLTVNRYGLVTKFTPGDGPGVRALTGGGGVTATETPPGSGEYLLGLAPVVAPASLTFGKYTVSVDATGRIVGLTVNPDSDGLVAGSFYSPAAPDGSTTAKIIHYDDNGVIVRAEPFNAPDIPAGP